MIDGKLAYNGNNTFFADKVPKGHVQSDIFASQSEEGHPFELEITWKARIQTFSSKYPKTSI